MNSEAELNQKRSSPSVVAHDSLADDLGWGAKALAAEINRTERQAYHLLETGQLPAQRIGGRWAWSRSGLRRHFAQVLGGPAA